MPDKRDSKHPGLFLKRSLSIEDIGEKKALVYTFLQLIRYPGASAF